MKIFSHFFESPQSTPHVYIAASLIGVRVYWKHLLGSMRKQKCKDSGPGGGGNLRKWSGGPLHNLVFQYKYKVLFNFLFIFYCRYVFSVQNHHKKHVTSLCIFKVVAYFPKWLGRTSIKKVKFVNDSQIAEDPPAL